MDVRYAEIAQSLDDEASRLGLELLDEEQKDALADPVQAFGMLDDLEARCGMHVDVARIGLSKLHYYVRVSADVLADLEDAAELLIGRYRGIDDEDVDGAAVHAVMAEGALEEYFDANTGGWVWISHSVHEGPHGHRLYVSASCDSVGVYLVPAGFDAAEEQAPTGRNTAQRMAEHINGLCGEAGHMLVDDWSW
jgi:hypothetical protein